MKHSPAYITSPQIATITKAEHTGKIRQNRKEKHFYQQLTLVAIDGNTLRELAQARFYATNAKHYCCMWIHNSPTNTHISGAGSAGGYGYHKASAAFSDAVTDAGIGLKHDVSGCGDGAIEDALKAIGIALGYAYEQMSIIFAHA